MTPSEGVRMETNSCPRRALRARGRVITEEILVMFAWSPSAVSRWKALQIMALACTVWVLGMAVSSAASAEKVRVRHIRAKPCHDILSTSVHFC